MADRESGHKLSVQKNTTKTIYHRESRVKFVLTAYSLWWIASVLTVRLSRN